jgi:hypothetical protein
MQTILHQPTLDCVSTVVELAEKLNYHDLPERKARSRNNLRSLAQKPVTLDSKKRKAVELAIRETCEIRKWLLWAFNSESQVECSIRSLPAHGAFSCCKLCWRSARVNSGVEHSIRSLPLTVL